MAEEGLDIEFEEIPRAGELEKYFDGLNDDYYGGLSNGTWFHIQESLYEYTRILKTEN